MTPTEQEELEAVQEVKQFIYDLGALKAHWVHIRLDVLRALLARATRSHD